MAKALMAIARLNNYRTVATVATSVKGQPLNSWSNYQQSNFVDDLLYEKSTTNRKLTITNDQSI